MSKPDSNNVATCDCTIQQYAPIVFHSTSYQNSADFVYEALKVKKAAATTGTLGLSAAGTPMFKSDYERMQYLLGRQKRASCGAPKKIFALE
jgi:hypothetical protein